MDTPVALIIIGGLAWLLPFTISIVRDLRTNNATQHNKETRHDD